MAQCILGASVHIWRVESKFKKKNQQKAKRNETLCGLTTFSFRFDMPHATATPPHLPSLSVPPASHSTLIIVFVLFFPFSVSPRCKPGTEQTSIGAINMHSIQVKCEVDADPPESVRFSWTYNNTRNVSPVSVMWIPTRAAE